MPSPEHEAFVAGLKPGGATPEVMPSAAELARMRESGDAPLPAGVTVERIDAGGVPALHVVPKDGKPVRTVLYFHGGGYIYMSPMRFVPVMAELAREAEAEVIGLDYRLAPEHPFPAPVEDALAAYRWLLSNGRSPGDIVLSGDSAGGGLVLVMLLAVRDAGLPPPAAGAAISPWTDLTVSGASADQADDPVVSGAALRFMATTYLGGADPLHPHASPLYGELAGLPPIQVQVGTREALLDDSRRFVERARAVGADIELIEHQDVAHMWIVYNPAMPEAQAAFAAVGAFVKAKAPVRTAA